MRVPARLRAALWIKNHYCNNMSRRILRLDLLYLLSALLIFPIEFFIVNHLRQWGVLGFLSQLIYIYSWIAAGRVIRLWGIQNQSPSENKWILEYRSRIQDRFLLCSMSYLAIGLILGVAKIITLRLIVGSAALFLIGLWTWHRSVSQITRTSETMKE